MTEQSNTLFTNRKSPLPTASKATSKAAAADRQWFKRNPHRSDRIRRTMISEMPHTQNQWVVVRQLEPGARIPKSVSIALGTTQMPYSAVELAKLLDMAISAPEDAIIGQRVFDFAVLSPQWRTP